MLELTRLLLSHRRGVVPSHTRTADVDYPLGLPTQTADPAESTTVARGLRGPVAHAGIVFDGDFAGRAVIRVRANTYISGHYPTRQRAGTTVVRFVETQLNGQIRNLGRFTIAVYLRGGFGVKLALVVADTGTNT